MVKSKTLLDVLSVSFKGEASEILGRGGTKAME